MYMHTYMYSTLVLAPCIELLKIIIFIMSPSTKEENQIWNSGIHFETHRC